MVYIYGAYLVVKKPVIETQSLTKSCNEALILAALGAGARHGYQLALEIERRGGGVFKFNHGTLYPILHKLEKDGLIEGTWSDEHGERRRKHYALTRKGRRYASEQLSAWREFIERFLDVVTGDKE
jgi:DNA-binding PadR family transcriptional regulator